MHIRCKDLYMKSSMKYIVSLLSWLLCLLATRIHIFPTWSSCYKYAYLMLFKSLCLLILSDKWLIIILKYIFLILLFAFISLLEFIWTFIHLLISVKFLISIIILEICLLFRIFILATKKNPFRFIKYNSFHTPVFLQ